MCITLSPELMELMLKKFCKIWIGIAIGALMACVIPSVTVFAPPHNVANGSLQEPPPLSIPSLREMEVTLWNPWRVKPTHVSNIDSETLWLARAMFSESKRLDEQELVGWIVRNRVNSNYRGCTTYQECVLDPFQFSAFLPSKMKLQDYTILTEMSRVTGWQKTLSLAFHIRYAHSRLRPFGYKVRHFYSEQSMLDTEIPPEWADNLSPIIPSRNIELDERRFRFYANVP